MNNYVKFVNKLKQPVRNIFIIIVPILCLIFSYVYTMQNKNNIAKNETRIEILENKKETDYTESIESVNTELQQQIDELKTTVNILTKENDSLKKQLKTTNDNINNLKVDINANKNTIKSINDFKNEIITEAKKSSSKYNFEYNMWMYFLNHYIVNK